MSSLLFLFYYYLFFSNWKMAPRCIVVTVLHINTYIVKRKYFKYLYTENYFKAKFFYNHFYTLCPNFQGIK